MRVAREGGEQQKKFEKKWKKFLTNEKFCDKMIWLCDEEWKFGARHHIKKNLKKLEKSAWQIRQDVIRWSGRCDEHDVFCTL